MSSGECRHNHLGQVMFGLDLLKAAEAEFERALALRLGYPQTYNNLGLTQLEMRRYDNANFTFKKALIYDPDFAQAHNNRHFPANLQIHGNRIYIAPPRELHSLRSPPMTRLWRADHVRKAIWQRFPPSRHTSPVFSTLPSISSAYAGTGLRRRSSIKAKIFWNKIFDTATSASWNVT